MSAWCNGAIGIGMARASWTGLGPDVAGDHAAALAALDRADGVLDHLCCGNFGRVELSLTSGLLDDAKRRAARLCRRASSDGGFGLTAEAATNVQHASLFRGVSGIGYEVLRLARPDIVPNVLLLG
jgi:lantibiotic modifying enzyme